jgi:DNA invertase Pin-like site-specific DNA recombinase
MTVAIYARVSTKDKGQEVENQLAQLRDYCRKQGWAIYRVYVDQKSGATSNREEFRRMFEGAARRQFDLVLFWALDRFSREGVLETLQQLQKLTASGVNWKSYTEQYLDSVGIFKEAVISIMATLAKQERVRISERTLAGLALARAKGKVLGPPKRVFDRMRAMEMRAAGVSCKKVAVELGVSKSLIHKLGKAS